MISEAKCLIKLLVQIVDKYKINNIKGMIHSVKFFRYQEWSFMSVFSRSANGMLICGPHNFNFSPIFCKIGKNDSYILKNYEIFFTFFKI
jgi:hypothetical protein